MIVWLIGARVTDRIWGPPSSAVVALAIAVVVGILTAVVSDRRFAHRLVTEVQRGAQP
jgi:dipeptide/tripeptide permease